MQRTSPAQARGAGHHDMRELNRSLVLGMIKEQSPISRAAIARSASLAKPTVSAIVEDLITEGVVHEIGRGEAASVGGRPPILLEYNASSQIVVGVHVGATKTTVVVADGAAVQLGRKQFKTPHTDGVAAMRRISKEIVKAVAANGADLKRVAAIGVVMPGMTDFHAGVCLLAPNLGWADLPIRDLISGELDVPVFVHHLGQAAAVAENLEGAGGRVSEMTLLYTGTGLGLGVISGGKVFHGAGGTTGEIGHCHIPGQTELCTCGRIGCLETVGSARAIVHRAEEALKSGAESVLRTRPADEPLTAAAVGLAAADGDAVALDAVTEVARNLGVGASWVLNLYNPEVLVVGGGLAELGDLLLDPIRAEVAEHALDPARRKAEIRLSQLGQDAEVRGAVLLALQHSSTSYRLVFEG